MTVLVVVETNWIEDVILLQKPSSTYLLDLAINSDVTIAIPEYSLHEADGALHRKIKKRIEEIDNFSQILSRISQGKNHQNTCDKVKISLKELRSLSLKERTKITEVINNIQQQVQLIPYTLSASINAELRYESSRPPFK